MENGSILWLLLSQYIYWFIYRMKMIARMHTEWSFGPWWNAICSVNILAINKWHNVSGRKYGRTWIQVLEKYGELCIASLVKWEEINHPHPPHNVMKDVTIQDMHCKVNSNLPLLSQNFQAFSRNIIILRRCLRTPQISLISAYREL